MFNFLVLFLFRMKVLVNILRFNYLVSKCYNKHVSIFHRTYLLLFCIFTSIYHIDSYRKLSICINTDKVLVDNANSFEADIIVLQNLFE